MERRGWLILTLEFNQEKNDEFWLLQGIFNEYIKQNIIIEALRKTKRKSDSNFNKL